MGRGIHSIQEAVSIVKKLIPDAYVKVAPQAKPYLFPKTTFHNACILCPKRSRIVEITVDAVNARVLVAAGACAAQKI